MSTCGVGVSQFIAETVERIDRFAGFQLVDDLADVFSEGKVYFIALFVFGGVNRGLNEADKCVEVTLRRAAIDGGFDGSAALVPQDDDESRS